MASAAGTSSSAAPVVQQVSATQHAGELAAAQQACDQAKADSANLQSTVQRLQSGSASVALVKAACALLALTKRNVTELHKRM